MNDNMYLLPSNGSHSTNNQNLRLLPAASDRFNKQTPEFGPYAPIEKRRLRTADGKPLASLAGRWDE